MSSRRPGKKVQGRLMSSWSLHFSLVHPEMGHNRTIEGDPFPVHRHTCNSVSVCVCFPQFAFFIGNKHRPAPARKNTCAAFANCWNFEGDAFTSSISLFFRLANISSACCALFQLVALPGLSTIQFVIKKHLNKYVSADVHSTVTLPIASGVIDNKRSIH